MIKKIRDRRVKRIPLPDKELLGRLTDFRARMTGAGNPKSEDASSPEIFGRAHRQNRSVANAHKAGLFRGLALVIIGVAVGYLGVNVLQDRQDDRLTNAWIRYETSAPDSPSRIGAIERLHKLGAGFAQFDWSCRKTGKFDDVQGKCVEKAYFNNIDLSPKRNTVFGLPSFFKHTAKLGGVNLSDASLGFARLNSAYLAGAKLSGSSAYAAKLRNAYLVEADLSKAYLMSAVLSGADVRGADLSEAVFRSADLTEANLSSSNLTKADFSEADLSRAVLKRANLSGAKFCYPAWVKSFGCARNLSQHRLDDAWAWADRPPTGLERMDPPLKLTKLCNPILRADYVGGRLGGRGVPKGC